MYLSSLLDREIFNLFKGTYEPLWKVDVPIYYDSAKKEVVFDLPGLSKDDVKVDFNPRTRVVRVTAEGLDASTRIPSDFKVEEASMKNGRLTLKLKEDAESVQSIEVK